MQHLISLPLIQQFLDTTTTSNIWSGMTGQWSDRSSVSSRKTLSPSGPVSYLLSLALRICTTFWRREGSWYGHVERSNGAVKTAFDIQVDGKHGPAGGPRWHGSTWQREWKLSAVDLQDRHTWRSGVRSAMRAASQLPGRGPTDVPLYLQVNQKSDDKMNIC